MRLLVFPFLFAFSFHVIAEVGPGLLWRVHQPKHPVSYLFGTIHVDDKRVKKLSKKVVKRFNEAKTLCLEILPDRETQVGIGRAMLLPKNQTLDVILGEPLFNRLSLALHKKGMSPLESVYLKPWAAMIVLSRPPSKAGLALDEQLYHWGMHQYKQLCALETLAEQLAVFDELSTADQVLLLTDTLNNLGVLQDLNEQLIQAYLSGNLDEIYRRSMEIEGADTPLSKRLRRKLIDDRNQIMLERMLPILNKGQAFVAVGALHLPGRKGLLHMLRERGFIVSSPEMPVSPW